MITMCEGVPRTIFTSILEQLCTLNLPLDRCYRADLLFPHYVVSLGVRYIYG